ncbi:glycosyltransferase [Elizabethkingia meningoseptica]|uniref:glycosyltransferase n=1 Tax=Elizabethkingia meningoseptica TaxID=238 RepID=UPI0013665991|nr:glycosyltransferase [Elizabethkingia meningoseptica]MDE5489047.1 glycosyltransferase [Elizabethkingia meningoseptica]MVW92309.1 glycosyltransferase family 1 protein [Elizabethkingia meningoseptica]
MKVLHIVTRIDSGGISSFLYNYYKYTDKQKVSFDIVAIGTGVKQGYHDQFESLGVNIYYMPDNIFKRFNFLAKLIRKNKYDVVHSHIELQSAVYLTVAAICGTKVRISHAHLSRANIGFKNKLLRGLMNTVVTKRVGASDLSLNAVFGEKNGKSGIVINNAVEVKKFSFNSEKRKQYRDELGLNNKLVLGFVGRLSYQKNIFFLTKVFAELAKLNPNVILLVVGDGELRKQMEENLHENNVLDKTLFLNIREDVDALMMAMDIMLLPSFYEGLPLVLVEAQCAALKCIVSDEVTKLISITDYIVYKGIGDNDVANWVKTIEEIGNNYTRESVDDLITEHNFNIEVEANKLMNFYNGQITSLK